MRCPFLFQSLTIAILCARAALCAFPLLRNLVSVFFMDPSPRNAMLKHHDFNNSILQMQALDVQHCLKGGGGADAWSQWLARIPHRGLTQTTFYTRQGSSERGLDLTPMLKQKQTLSFATGCMAFPCNSSHHCCKIQ